MVYLGTRIYCLSSDFSFETQTPSHAYLGYHLYLGVGDRLLLYAHCQCCSYPIITDNHCIFFMSLVTASKVEKKYCLVWKSKTISQMIKSLYFAIKTYITEGHICHCGYNEQRAAAPCYIRTNMQTHMIICTVLLKRAPLQCLLKYAPFHPRSNTCP